MENEPNRSVESVMATAIIVQIQEETGILMGGVLVDVIDQINNQVQDDNPLKGTSAIGQAIVD